MPNLPRNHITSHRAASHLVPIVILIVWVVLAAGLVIRAEQECSEAIAAPAKTLSNTLGSAVQRANEQPGTGYIANPRQ